MIIIHSNSFSGEAATKWFQKVLKCEERDALLCGQRMVKEKLIRHETNTHGFRNNTRYFYIFVDLKKNVANKNNNKSTSLRNKKSLEFTEKTPEICNFYFYFYYFNLF